jgi:uncharacterized membrane protein YhhN
MFNILFIIAAVVEVPLVALFLKYYWPDRCKQSFITKVICSLLFVLMGIFAAKETGNNTLFADYMIWGLVFGMAGDLLLHAMTTKMLPFILGVVAFLIGHIFYIMAIQRAIYTVGLSKGAFIWYELLIIAVIVVIAVIYCLKTNAFKRKGPMVYGLLAYGVVLATMLAKAVRYVVDVIAFGVDDNMYMIALTVGLGAVLFFLSDASLGIILTDDKPVKRGMRIFNITTYYAAQVLLAASIFFVFSRELY